MLKALIARLNQGHRTASRIPEDLPERTLGRPTWQPVRCTDGCQDCARVCPTAAIVPGQTLDLGRCLFCGECARVCTRGAIRFGRSPGMAVRRRSDLVLAGPEMALAEALEEKSLRLFQRSLRLRQVSAAGCNACEADVNVLGTLTFDLARFGIDFVASPRHADGLLVTGPVSQNMREALLKTWEAVPAPRLVVAVGSCAISGGPYFDHPETCGGADGLLPIDLYVPGCPPNPWTILEGLLRLLDRLEEIRPTG